MILKGGSDNGREERHWEVGVTLGGRRDTGRWE